MDHFHLSLVNYFYYTGKFYATASECHRWVCQHSHTQTNVCIFMVNLWNDVRFSEALNRFCLFVILWNIWFFIRWQLNSHTQFNAIQFDSTHAHIHVELCACKHTHTHSQTVFPPVADISISCFSCLNLNLFIQIILSVFLTRPFLSPALSLFSAPHLFCSSHFVSLSHTTEYFASFLFARVRRRWLFIALNIQQ